MYSSSRSFKISARPVTLRAAQRKVKSTKSQAISEIEQALVELVSSGNTIGSVGAGTGSVVGLSVGSAVGATVGLSVGSAVGAIDGLSEGPGVGAPDGLPEGPADGSAVGASEGGADGASVGASVDAFSKLIC